MIAIELDGKVFAPLLDSQGNICRLIDPYCKQAASYTFTAFGEQKHAFHDTNPWRFASKRYDADLKLINFGKRYYDPENGRWLTTDPAGLLDSVNLYQYTFNNPYRYCDPDGQLAMFLPLFIWGANLALPTLSACVMPMIYGTVASIAVYGGYKAVQSLNGGGGYDYNCAPVLDSLLLHLPYDPESGCLKTNRSTKKEREKNYPGSPEDLEKNPDWKETTHPEEAKSGRRVFENPKTGEKIEYDKGRPNETGHKAHDHYHRLNPTGQGKGDKYLDSNGNPVPKGSPGSHLYPPKGTTWS